MSSSRPTASTFLRVSKHPFGMNLSVIGRRKVLGFSMSGGVTGPVFPAIGNLIISKTFLISQLGYLLSMMDCPKEILAEIQKDIDAFILKTSNNWISKDRIHVPPEQGGLGAINLEIYATSLRCSWYKRVNHGLWKDILMAKVNHSENICFIKENQIHKMHIAIRPIARTFEQLQKCFLKTTDDLKKKKKNTGIFQSGKNRKCTKICNRRKLSIPIQAGREL